MPDIGTTVSATPAPSHRPDGCLRISDFLDWARISKTKAYAEIKAGRLRMVKCGRRSLIRMEDAVRWRDGLLADRH